MINIRVLGDRVLVALPPKVEVQDDATGYTYQEKVTTSGIILAKPPDAYDVEVATRGIVMQLGEKTGTVDLDDVLSAIGDLETRPEWAARDDAQMCRDAGPAMVRLAEAVAALKRLNPAPFDVAVGDMVIFPPNVGEQFSQDGIDYVILSESQIAGVVLASEAA